MDEDYVPTTLTKENQMRISQAITLAINDEVDDKIARLAASPDTYLRVVAETYTPVSRQSAGVLFEQGRMATNPVNKVVKTTLQRLRKITT